MYDARDSNIDRARTSMFVRAICDYNTRGIARTESHGGNTMSRPTGVTIIAILAFISGLLGLCGALPVFGISLIAGAFVPPVGVIGTIIGIVLTFAPILMLIFAYGAWNLRAWSWMLGIIATGVSVFSALIAVVTTGNVLAIGTHGLLPIIVFIYLLLPDTRKAFNV